MSSTKSASKKPYYAIRAYLPDNKKERKAITDKLEKAAKLQNRSVSYYVLTAAIAQAERDLAGAR